MCGYRKTKPRWTSHFIIATLLLVLSLPLITNASIIKIKIYGKGGVRISPPQICPEASSQVCAELNIFGSGSTDGEAIDTSGNRYRIVLKHSIAEGTTELQGADLELESVEPIE